jgi:(p)ppGpp synthase/HD superfamily hydrolase
MKPPDRARLAEAFRFALDAHAEQTRKGSDVPYASHLLQVAGLVLEHGGDATLAAAGVLHDAVEDCAAIDLSMLHANFGEEVARIVAACTDLLPGDRADAKGDWLSRKQRYLARLREADVRTRLVAACDKLHNLRSLVADLRAEGVGTLARFRASPAQTRWYFEAAREALCGDLPQRLVDELDRLLDELELFVPHAGAEPEPGSEA